MIQKLKAVLDDDRGVSPVIGVILMVAITVILAAVIGTFVLNLGGDLQSTPQAQLSIEQGDSASTLTISHNGGDTLQADNLEVVDGDGNPLSNDLSGEFSVGNTATLDDGNTNLAAEGSEMTVRIIHTPSDTILVENTVTVPSSS